MNRACMVSDKDTCALFKEVWLDDKVARSAAMTSYNIAPDTVVTMGRVKPHGLQWEALQRAFDDPDFNVSFSVRNLSTDQPAFVFMADESPLHRKLGLLEQRD